MDGYISDARRKVIFDCLPSFGPQNEDTTLNAKPGNRNRLLSFRCTCQQAKVKVPVTLDNDDPVAIGGILKSMLRRDTINREIKSSSGNIKTPHDAAQHLQARVCTPEWKEEHKHMKINEIVVIEGIQH